MDTPSWTEQPLPRSRVDQLPGWDWELHRAADLTRSRTELKANVLGAGIPPGDIADAVERLLLAYEELASNGFRHGRAPVETVVIARLPRPGTSPAADTRSRGWNLRHGSWSWPAGRTP